jgi:hypothetical protein
VRQESFFQRPIALSFTERMTREKQTNVLCRLSIHALHHHQHHERHKMRLPKPIAKSVQHGGCFIGNVYSREQMHAFAAKAINIEQQRILALLREELTEDAGDLWCVCVQHIIDKIKAQND